MPDQAGDRQHALLANMRQKLLAPANALVGYAEMLREEAVRRRIDAAVADLDQILEAGRDLFDHVDQLLDRNHARDLLDGADSAQVQRALRHDLRTPINAIKGYSEMLLEDIDDLGAKGLGTDLSKMLAEADDLLMQLDRIVDFTRRQSDPVADAAVSSVLQAKAPDQQAVETGYVLVVDDNRSNRDLLSRRLAREGHRVALAEDGPTALDMVAAEDFDVILLDVMMPGMDGFTVCRMLKQNDDTRLIPVLIMTALDAIEDRIKGIEAGADDFLIKPLNNKELLARIGTVLKLKRIMDEKLGELRSTKDRFAKLESIYHVTKVHKERMEAELSIGRDIQMSMIPLNFPEQSEFSIHAILEPAREVGGDFYDLFFIDDHHFCVCIGDVVGKGVPAALFMAVTKTVIKSRARNDLSAASILTHVNDELSRDNPNAMFATVLLATIDIRTGDLHYGNAGHNAPLIRRLDGTVDRLDEVHQLPLGAMGGVTYREITERLQSGDLFLLYTDGVTEAMNPQEQLFGDERLARLCGAGPAPSASQMTDRLLSAVREFESGTEQADDITLLSLQFHGRSRTAANPCHLVLKNHMAELGRVADAVDAFCDDHAIDAGIRRKLHIVLDDWIDNIISYAYADDRTHDIDLGLALDGDYVVVTVVDDGQPFDPLAMPAADTSSTLADRKIGGLGIELIRGLSDKLTYERADDKNLLTARFLHAAPSDGQARELR